MADGLRAAGARVDLDHTPSLGIDLQTEAAELTRELKSAWTEQRPDVVHAHGSVACSAALAAAAGEIPVVVTTDEPSAGVGHDRDLVDGAAALVVRSRSERDAWLGQDVERGRLHVVPLPITRLAQVPPDRTRTRLVVTDARGRMLERVVASMRFWPPDARLAVVGPLTTSQLARARALASGASDRLEVADSAGPLWQRACLVLAGPCSARHAGLVLEGAGQGIPALAVDAFAHSEVVVDGATGLLMPQDVGSRRIGQLVGEMLGDTLRLRGYGLAAHLRVGATHDPSTVAGRCLAVYESVIAEAAGGAPVAGLAPVGHSLPGEASADDAASGSPGEWHDLVIAHLPVARRLAQRYAGRGQSVEDLVQVANLGLVKAAQRFDPEQGTPFVAYAVPTMLGELRRYFRDNAWAIHVPRSVQEKALRVRQSGDRLRQDLGHEVDAAEIARDLGMKVEDVDEARNASGVAFACRSLDAALLEEGDGRLSELLGATDHSLEHVEAREALRGAFTRLPAREREILVLRFFGELTQSEIAEQLGISQMHVSRLLARTLRMLREHVVEDVPLPSGWGAAAS